MKNEPIRDEFLEKRKARQKKARKRKAIISLIFTIFTLAVITVILCLTVFFSIETVSVSGSKIYTDEEIIKQSGIRVGDNIFTFGEKNSVEQLKNKLPFIETVEFERELPNKLYIKVSDAKAYYCLKKDNSYYSVSEAGWVLEKTTEKPEGVFEVLINDIECNVGNQIIFKNEKADRILNDLTLLLVENAFSIDYIDVTNTTTLKVGIDNRFDVELGTENDLESKIKELKTMKETISKDKKGLIRLYMWNQQKPYGTFVENSTK